MDLPKIDLEFLTEDERLRELCRRYWRRDGSRWVEAPSHIAQELGIGGSELPARLAEYSTAHLRGVTCSSCSRELTFSKRSNARPYLLPDPPPRPTPPAECEACIDARQAEAEKRARDKVEARYEVSKFDPTDPYGGGVREVLFFLALHALGSTDDDPTRIQSIHSLKVPLTPAGRLNLSLANVLFEQGLIVPDPASPLDAFFWESDEPTQFYVDKVSWVVPGPPNEIPAVLRILRDRLRDARLNVPELEHVWHEIAAAELHEFLAFSLDVRGLPCPEGERITQVINMALRHFPVAHLFRAAWGAVPKTEKWEEERGLELSPESLANGALTFFENSVNTAVERGWHVQPGFRNPRCPQSMVSKMLSQAVAGDDEAIFTLGLEGALALDWSPSEPQATVPEELDGQPDPPS